MSGWELFDWLEPRYVLWIVAGLTVVTVVVFNLGPVSELKARVKSIPESSGGFSAEELREHLSEINRSKDVYKRDAHELYSSHLGWDSVFAVIYGIALSLVMAGVWREGIAVGWLDGLETLAIVLPLLFAAWDLAENAELSRAIAAIPREAVEQPPHSKTSASSPAKPSTKAGTVAGTKPLATLNLRSPIWGTRGKWIYGFSTLVFLVAGLIGLVADQA